MATIFFLPINFAKLTVAVGDTVQVGGLSNRNLNSHVRVTQIHMDNNTLQVMLAQRTHGLYTKGYLEIRSVWANSKPFLNEPQVIIPSHKNSISDIQLYRKSTLIKLAKTLQIPLWRRNQKLRLKSPPNLSGSSGVRTVSSLLSTKICSIQMDRDINIQKTNVSHVHLGYTTIVIFDSQHKLQRGTEVQFVYPTLRDSRFTQSGTVSILNSICRS